MKRNLLIAGLLGMSLLMAGCEKNVEVNPERDIEGYIVSIDNNEICIGTSVGEIYFDATNASIEADNGLDVDEVVEVFFYYDGDIEDGGKYTANKIVEEIMNVLVSTAGAYDANEDIVYMYVDEAEYKFDLKGIKHEPITLDAIYEVQCDKKIELNAVNVASSFEAIAVDDAPSEEIELVEENINYVEE